MYAEVTDSHQGIVDFFDSRGQYGFIRPLDQPKGSREGQVWFSTKGFRHVQAGSIPDLVVWQRPAAARLSTALVNTAVIFELSFDSKGRPSAMQWTFQDDYNEALKSAARKPRRTMMWLG